MVNGIFNHPIKHRVCRVIHVMVWFNEKIESDKLNYTKNLFELNYFNLF